MTPRKRIRDGLTTAQQTVERIVALLGTTLSSKADYHQEAKEQLRGIGWGTDRFGETVAYGMAVSDTDSAGEEPRWDSLSEAYAFYLDECRSTRVPDGFLVCPELRTVVLLEIDITHPTPIDKWAHWAFALDCYEWDISVMRSERAGRASVAYTADALWEAHIQALIDQRAA